MKRNTNTINVTVTATSATEWTAAFDVDGLKAILEESEVSPSAEVEVSDGTVPTYVNVVDCCAEEVEVEANVVFEGAPLTEDEREAIVEKLEWPCVSFKCFSTVEYRVRNRGRSKECHRDVHFTADWTTGDTGMYATYSVGC